MIGPLARVLTRVVCVQPGHPDYERVVGALRYRRRLLARMWQDAESRLDEQPGKLWWVAVPRWGPKIAMAWCAAVLDQDEHGTVWRCCNSYDRPGWRWLRLYPSVYQARHREVVDLPAYTYVYAQPLALHLADGWQIVGEGDSSEPDAPSHHWFKLRRHPTPANRSDPGMIMEVFSMPAALAALDQPGFGTGADTDVHLQARWEVTVADALELGAWFVETIGVETIEEKPLQHWLAGLLQDILGVDDSDAEDVAEQAADQIAERLGLDTEETAYEDEGMVADPPEFDLLHEAIEHTGGKPGQLLRELATQLRG